MDLNLTLEVTKQLQILNTRLKSLETKLLNEAIKIDDELSRRVVDKADFLDDYEMEVKIELYLQKDENDSEDDEDVMLVFLNESLKGISKDCNKLDRFGKNNNEFLGLTNHPMKDENHSWWYHCLYDHTNLKFNDLTKIGIIWSDIQVSYQYQDLQ